MDQQPPDAPSSLRLVAPPPKKPFRYPATSPAPSSLRLVAPAPKKPFRYPEQPERIFLTHNGRFLPKGIASLSKAELRSFKKMGTALRGGTTRT